VAARALITRSTLMAAVKACKLLEYNRRRLLPVLVIWPVLDRRVLPFASISPLVAEGVPA